MANAARIAVETVANAVRYSDGTILLKDVRASYPHVMELHTQTDDEGKVTESYGIVGLMPKDTHDEAKKLLQRVLKQILADKNEGKKVGSDRQFIKDGDPKLDEDGEPEPGKEENAGMWVVSTRERPGHRPKTLHRVKDPETGKAKRLDPKVPADCEVIYGGCYVNMLIRPWWQNNPKYGKRINAGIVAVQFLRDGEPFGAGRIKEDDLDDTFGVGEEETYDGGEEL